MDAVWQKHQGKIILLAVTFAVSLFFIVYLITDISSKPTCYLIQTKPEPPEDDAIAQNIIDDNYKAIANAIAYFEYIKTKRNSLGNNTATIHKQSIDDDSNTKYMILDLRTIEYHVFPEYELLNLDFDCCQMKFFWRLGKQWASMNSIQVQLRVPNDGERTCYIESQHLIKAPISRHYSSCTDQVKLDCFDAPKNVVSNPTLIGHLVFDKLEFEMGGNSSIISLGHFSTDPNFCGE